MEARSKLQYEEQGRLQGYLQSVNNQDDVDISGDPSSQFLLNQRISILSPQITIMQYSADEDNYTARPERPSLFVSVIRIESCKSTYRELNQFLKTIFAVSPSVLFLATALIY